MYLLEDDSASGVYAVVGRVAGVSGKAYSADGSLMHVPVGSTATVTLATASTAVIRARNAGQALTVGGVTVTSAAPNQVLRVFGSGTATLGPGDWAQLTIVEGQYDGPPFDGDLSPDPSKWDTAWNGTPNASTSVLKTAPEGAVWPGWAPGVGVPQVVVGDPQQTLQLATSTEVRSDYTVTIREVG